MFQTAHHDGIGSLEGAFSSLLLQDSAEELSFTITGELAIYVDRFSRSVTTGLANAGGQAEWDGPYETSGMAQVHLAKRGDFWLYEMDGVGALESLQGTFEAQDQTFAWGQQYHESAPTILIPTLDLVFYETGPGGSLQANGNFSFALWGGALEAGNQQFWAGQQTEQSIPGTPVGLQSSQVIHVQVNHGSIHLESKSESLQTHWLQLQAEGLGSFKTAATQDEHAKPLGALTSEGRWSMQMHRDEALVASDLEADGLALNGVLQEDASFSPWWWLLLAPLLLLARPTKFSVWNMKRNLDAGRYQAVSAFPIRRVLRGKHAPRASLYRTTALLALGLYQEASLFLASLEAKARPDPATYQFLHAHALAGVGSMDAARNALQECIQLAPSYAKEAAYIPMLAKLLVERPRADLS